MTEAIGHMRARLFGVAVVVALLAAGVATAGFALAGAQDEPPAGHPAHIHEGTCAELNAAVLQPLSPVGPRTNDDGELPAAEDFQGTTESAAVQVSRSEGVEISMDDLLGGAHAINIHESDENIDNYIACADLGGFVIDDELVVAVKPLNNSGYAGVARIESDDDNVNVTIYLFSDVLGEGGATPATPAP